MVANSGNGYQKDSPCVVNVQVAVNLMDKSAADAAAAGDTAGPSAHAAAAEAAEKSELDTLQATCSDLVMSSIFDRSAMEPMPFVKYYCAATVCAPRSSSTGQRHCHSL